MRWLTYSFECGLDKGIGLELLMMSYYSQIWQRISILDSSLYHLPNHCSYRQARQSPLILAPNAIQVNHTIVHSDEPYGHNDLIPLVYSISCPLISTWMVRLQLIYPFRTYLSLVIKGTRYSSEMQVYLYGSILHKDANDFIIISV